MYTIIEDCSPFYIRFVWDGIEDDIAFVERQPLALQHANVRSSYTHWNYAYEQAVAIIGRLPFKSKFQFMMDRVALFITPPRAKAIVHQDGPDHRFSLNLAIEVNDDKCITEWYSDEEMQKHELRRADAYTRQKHIDKKPPSVKSIIFKSNEAILLNTEIFHSWDHTASSNRRIMLTLRVTDPGLMYFDDAKRILFGNVAESGLLPKLHVVLNTTGIN